jgi:hypothetical protein
MRVVGLAYIVSVDCNDATADSRNTHHERSAPRATTANATKESMKAEGGKIQPAIRGCSHPASGTRLSEQAGPEETPGTLLVMEITFSCIAKNKHKHGRLA